MGPLPGDRVREREREAGHVLAEHDPVARSVDEALELRPGAGDDLLGLVAGRGDLLPVRHPGEHVVAHGVEAAVDHLRAARAVEELPAAGLAEKHGRNVGS